MRLFGVLIFLVGLAILLYGALWICIIGGITDMVEAVKANEFAKDAFIVGLLKFFATVLVSPIGWFVTTFGLVTMINERI